ncbi:MAG: hypothetical protein Kow0069_38040 [Promethearchaeota archaeon]
MTLTTEATGKKDRLKTALLSLEKALSKPRYRKLSDALVVGFFVVVVLGPVINIFTTVFSSIGEVRSQVFDDPLTGDYQWRLMVGALARSFQIAALAVAIDFLVGFPMAILLARFEFRGKRLLDAMVDLPLAVPTSALGLSISLFWGTRWGLASLFGLESGFFSPGPSLILVTHVIFTFPFLTRSLKVVLQETPKVYEDAASTLGAPGFTVFRTITGPLVKEGAIAGTTLAFTRSLGETGATLMVAGLSETAPIVIVGLRRQLQIPAASFLSLILISVCLFLLFGIKTFSRKVGFPIKKVWPTGERFLSKPAFRKLRNGFAVIVFFAFVFVPALFIFAYLWRSASDVPSQLFGPDLKWAHLWTSLVNSILVGGITTFVVLATGVPMAFIIKNRKWGKFNDVLDVLVDVPLSIPSAALGFATFLFWGPSGLQLFSPGFWMIVWVHVAFTFPYVIRPVISVVEKSNPGLEDASRTLGASNLTTFRKVTFPVIKAGVLAGAIMSFARSLGETGATIVVMGDVRTIPVLIVDWVESRQMAAAAFASACVILFSFLLLVALRRISNPRRLGT